MSEVIASAVACVERMVRAFGMEASSATAQPVP